MLSRGCQNLRTLDIDYMYCSGTQLVCVEQALPELLQNCTKLERLFSTVYFDPNGLRNCRNLTKVELVFNKERTKMFSHLVTSDLLKRLYSVEEFSLYRRSLYRMDYHRYLTRVTASILEHCPQLTSLRCLDSSAALKELHDRDLRTCVTPRRFQLRRCHWDVGKRCISKFEYCDRIRVAAFSCPMVGVLWIEVRYAVALRHLQALRNLTCFLIRFNDYDDYGNDYVHLQELYTLLEEIGPQLRYLCVHGDYVRKPLNLTVVCGNCPNLCKLEINCLTTVDEDVKPCANLLSLERLIVGGDDRRSLIFLLSNCLHLKVLYVYSCQELEDGAMQVIIRNNSFTELLDATIYGCNLSEVGCRSFVRSAVKLVYCSVESKLLGRDEKKRCLKDLDSLVCGGLIPSDPFPPSDISPVFFKNDPASWKIVCNLCNNPIVCRGFVLRTMPRCANFM